MARQCLLKMFGNECAFISYKLVVNWRYTPVDGEPDPPFMQFDGGENPAEKFKQMDKQGALFVDPDTLSNEQWVAKCLEDRTVEDYQKMSTQLVKRKSKANFVIRFFHSTFELLCAVIPGLERLTLAYIFPFYAYYLVI
ncbi:Nucleotid-trans domain-containing protein [Aphelenchoides bicaudatus]|nr:Nucleotid-trans domain-containing protein [Aphelenchoides bicaudatus]